ncbi:exosortase C-terminal domain/associated protein EpsI [Candidatus Omnitrophota bacterium]
MRNRIRKVIGILFIAAACTVFSAAPGAPRIDEDLYAERIPLRIGKWKGAGAEVPGWITDILGTEDVVVRTYAKSEKDTVHLNITFGYDRPRAFYPPDYCHIGAGWELASKGTAFFDTDYREGPRVQAAELFLRKDLKWIVSLYWFKSGGRTTASYFRHQMEMRLNRIRRGSSSGALIQVFAETETGGLKRAEENVKEFAGLVFPIIQEKLP